MASFGYEGARPELNADIGSAGFSRTRHVEDKERTARILDAKWRTLGVDKQALDGQVQEKMERRITEDLQTLSFAKLANFLDNEVQRAVQEASRLKRELARNEVAFREANQLQHTRREWDINRPDHVKLQQPLRTLGEDARERDAALGVSSAQVFHGEDPAAAARRLAQLAQQRQWVAQQVAEKRARAQASYEDDLRMAALSAAQDAFAIAVQQEEFSSMNAATKKTSDTNLALARLKAARDAAWRAAQTESNENEIATTNGSAFMTEDPATGVSSFQAHRKRPDHYKGQSEEEKHEVADFQASQRDENATRRANEKAAEMARAKADEALRRQMNINAHDREDFIAEQNRLVAASQANQKQEKNERDAEDLAYVNRPGYGDGFFNRFGAGHR